MNTLTKTQAIIVQLLADGQTPKQVAANRYRSLGTIRKHIELAKVRTGAKTIGHLVKIALKQGVINSIFVSLIISQAMPGSTARPDTKRRVRVARSFSVSAGRVRTNEV